MKIQEAPNGSAIFSDDGECRFMLSRWWGSGKRALVCTANPSSAGAETNDPTIANLIKLVRKQGYDGFNAVNWCPLISSNPLHMYTDWRIMREHEPERWEQLNKQNLEMIAAALDNVAIRIAAWGNITPLVFEPYSLLAALTEGRTLPLYAFALTSTNNPRHPLARGKSRIRPGMTLERFEWMTWADFENSKIKRVTEVRGKRK